MEFLCSASANMAKDDSKLMTGRSAPLVSAEMANAAGPLRRRRGVVERATYSTYCSPGDEFKRSS